MWPLLMLSTVGFAGAFLSYMTPKGLRIQSRVRVRERSEEVRTSAFVMRGLSNREKNRLDALIKPKKKFLTIKIPSRKARSLWIDTRPIPRAKRRKEVSRLMSQLELKYTLNNVAKELTPRERMEFRQIRKRLKRER